MYFTEQNVHIFDCKQNVHVFDYNQNVHVLDYNQIHLHFVQPNTCICCTAKYMYILLSQIHVHLDYNQIHVYFAYSQIYVHFAQSNTCKFCSI
jgi:hypothetical protein